MPLTDEEVCANITKNMNAMMDALFPPAMFNQSAIVNERNLCAGVCTCNTEQEAEDEPLE